MPLSIQFSSQLGTPPSWDDAASAAHGNPAMRDAVAYFRRVLGDRWRGWERRAHLARLFHVSLQDGDREWVRLHRLAMALVGVSNVELLVKDLGSPGWQVHVAAEQALEFCGRLRGAGHRVEVIQPEGRRSPDVRVWLHDRPVTLEFKALHDPDEQMPWDAFLDALHGEMFRRRPEAEVLPFWAEFFDPALHHLQEVAEALTAIAERGDAELHDLPHGSGRARFVADASGVHEFRLPIEKRSDLDRVVANLGAKYRRQLRTIAGPTLLVVLTQHMFPVTERLPSVVRHVVGTLQDELAAKTTMSGLLLHEEPFLPPFHAVLHVESGWRFVLGATERRARAALLVQNDAAKFDLIPQELDVLISENVRW